MLFTPQYKNHVHSGKMVDFKPDVSIRLNTVEPLLPKLLRTMTSEGVVCLLQFT